MKISLLPADRPAPAGSDSKLVSARSVARLRPSTTASRCCLSCCPRCPDPRRRTMRRTDAAAGGGSSSGGSIRKPAQPCMSEHRPVLRAAAGAFDPSWAGLPQPDGRCVPEPRRQVRIHRQGPLRKQPVQVRHTRARACTRPSHTHASRKCMDSRYNTPPSLCRLRPLPLPLKLLRGKRQPPGPHGVL